MVKNTTIIAVGKLKEPYKGLAEDFEKRIRRFLNLKVVEIPESNKKGETKKVIKKIKELRGIKILCDIRGKLIDDKFFDEILEKEAIFIIGGPDGFEEEIKEHVDEVISFSKLTFNHQLFRIMLLEQIYRAIARKKNLPYAKH